MSAGRSRRGGSLLHFAAPAASSVRGTRDVHALLRAGHGQHGGASRAARNRRRARAEARRPRRRRAELGGLSRAESKCGRADDARRRQADLRMRLAPAAGSADRGLFLQWMLHFPNVVQPAFRIWFSPEKYAGEGSVVAKAIARQQIEAGWQRFDAFVAARGPYALGADFGVLDIY